MSDYQYLEPEPGSPGAALFQTVLEQTWGGYRIAVTEQIMGDFNPLWAPWLWCDRPLIGWQFEPFPRWARLCTRVRAVSDRWRQRIAERIWHHECDCEDLW
jgi:hypothetical protein